MNWINCNSESVNSVNDYTMFYLLMVVAGIILAVWSINKRKKEKPPTPPHPTPSPSPTKTPIPDPPIQLAKDVSHIYAYRFSRDRSTGRIWVCRDCEIENRDEDDRCSLCGASRY